MLPIDHPARDIPDQEYFNNATQEFIKIPGRHVDDEGYVCDAGIIYAPRPFLLCVMTYAVPDARFILGEIARIAMDYAEYLAETEGPMPAKSDGAK